MSNAWARPSSAHGPAIKASGNALPKRTLPTATAGFGFAVMVTLAGDHASPARRGQRRRYFTAENAVGCKIWLLALSKIAPSFSLAARAEIQSGSAMNAFHFFSRSASDSQASR